MRRLLTGHGFSIAARCLSSFGIIAAFGVHLASIHQTTNVPVIVCIVGIPLRDAAPQEIAVGCRCVSIVGTR